MATQAERREATRSGLIRAARGLFCEKGIAGTTTQDVLEGSGVSRGAMYHHFASREDLVAAVYEHEAAGAIERASARRGAGGSPIEDLLASCLAWLDEVGRRDVARILIVDGPAALGWARCREIEERHSLGRVRAGLEAAVRAGEVDVVSSDLVARMLNAVLTEAALSIVRSRQRRKARREAEAAIRQLVSGLRPSESSE